MTATAIPQVIDALVAFGIAAVPAGVEVVDGYTMSTAPSSAAQFIVGVSDPQENGIPAVESRQERLAGYGEQRQEFLDVHCRLTTYPMGTLKESRDTLQSVLTAIDDGLRADGSLGGVVIAARLGSDFALYQADGPTGDRIRIDFTVTADLYL